MADDNAGRISVGTTPSPASVSGRLSPRDFCNPAALLSGTVDDDMYRRFRDQLAAAPTAGVICIELSTLGGDPEIARMMGEDIIFHSEIEPERRFVFLGKAALYSAGTTFMSFFVRQNRYLTRGTRLLVHERQLDKPLRLKASLSSCEIALERLLNEVRASMEIQREGFENLARGSQISAAEIAERARRDWYVEAAEALQLGLVEGVI